MSAGYPRPMTVDDLNEILQMREAKLRRFEAALKEIADGFTDEGGNGRNHPNATQIARKALKLQP